MKNFIMLILGIVIGALAVYFYCCQPKTELMVSTPKGLISPDQAKTLDQAYNERYRLISDSLVKREGGDNRSSWYGLDEVRNYLNYAENEAKDLGYTMDGVRIYLGAHPNENGKAGYTTMFFMPTGKSNKANAGLLDFFMQSDGGDIPGGGGLDFGNHGHPPGANYPQ
ncbi:hypothetical protein [Gelidibacter pelagius]|uniref:Uncharacterized protein n=1 Tax=Gelidibacter pelagius TaxID=2819985 RepID=A0ABS3SR65_9FLAO|nr:hypothetical protein [Gelidibacter pelagius]MBO3098210.1 hypothetical protein [Gelidibacter pelagius]